MPTNPSRNYPNPRMGNVSFDEHSSNFSLPTGLPVIPDIHIPLQVDDRASRDILHGRGDSPDAAAEQDSEQEEGHAKRSTTGAQASTFTLTGGPPNAPNAEGARAGLRPLKDIDPIPPPPTDLGPMPYNHLCGDELGSITNEF
ncbi:hypothetical protein RHMOL_Rhmol03G0140200 [Rhododendron molle]|uniref:Uncharacterized protein n=1 Tax=Rhododendron molle TaxID=49168 RepID=A0ACC0PFN8_RHOML|nr:hypothetical protein RHMOL_Rhmol03G0140200 [Rhododendron molle]